MDINRRDKGFRVRVASLAQQVIANKLSFFAFLDEIGGDDSAYKTGDDEVDALIDLLEHEPGVGGLFGVSEEKHKQYVSRINKIINKLTSSAA